MSAHSTNVVQTNTEEFRPILRPIYHILRPGNRLVPLIAGDELPCWLKVVGSWWLDVTNIVTVNKGDPYPRKGEYDIICQYCVDATNHMHMQDETRNDANREEQGRGALRERAYAPTGQNQYAQRVPATTEVSVQQLIQPNPVRPLQPQFMQPAQFHQPVQTFPGAFNLSPIQPTHTRPPPLLPANSSLSLPSMPSLPSQPSGLQSQALQQAMQLQSLQQPPQPQQPQLQYQQQQMYPPQQLQQQQQMYLLQQPSQQQLNWWQDRGRTKGRDQLRYHPWDYKSPPGQPRRRLPREEPQLQLRSRSPIVNAREGEETRGLNATAPAFTPSATPPG